MIGSTQPRRRMFQRKRGADGMKWEVERGSCAFTSVALAPHHAG
jgi:hypothetical protein